MDPVFPYSDPAFDPPDKTGSGRGYILHRSAPAPSARRADGHAALPCLNRNNDNKEGETSASPERETTPSEHRKKAYALQENIKAWADRHGVERLGFLTLTFADHVTDAKEAYRRFKSLTAGALGRYTEWVRVIERQKSGRIHYHLLVLLPNDIRTGFDFTDLDRTDKRFPSANKYLRAEWQFWRETARSYGFGRTELLPIKSTSEGVGKYIGKYIGKHMGCRLEEDKGVRLVGYSRGFNRKVSPQFSWRAVGNDLWRLKLGYFARMHGDTPDNYLSKMKERYGKNWVFHLKEAIANLRLPSYPTAPHFLRDYPDSGMRDSVEAMLATEIRCADEQGRARALAFAFAVARDLRNRNLSRGKEDNERDARSRIDRKQKEKDTTEEAIEDLEKLYSTA